jgi:GNAT superfamily N-acetyltransferase
MSIETRELTPAMWPVLEELFGTRGACGGCWCMFWRIAKGESWDEVKGRVARTRLRDLVIRGEVHGVLAFCEGRPVGWCTFGPRPDFARLDRSPSLACDDSARVWSVPCFFVRAGYRGRGVATALLRCAIQAMKRRGVRVIEGYPVRSKERGKAIPAAFAWTGTRSLFDKAGFRIAGNEGGGKERVRLTVR